MLAAIDFVMNNFNGQNFLICGKTVTSAIKNLIIPYMKLSYVRKKYNIKFTRTDNKMIVRFKGRENSFLIYGGKDESSYMLVQGVTACGALLDEVALMCESFVNQVTARCSVEGSKLFFSCNPDSPEHFFYKDWILKAKEKNALYVQFALEDNPSLSEKMIARYKSMYTGAFYDKYILGKWTIAEGVIYDCYDKALNTPSEYLMHSLLTKEDFNTLISTSPSFNTGPAFSEGKGGAISMLRKPIYYITIDYGITNPFVALLWSLRDGEAVCLKEYYYSPKEHNGKKRTDEEHYEAVEALAKGYNIECIIVDPSANSFKEVIRRHDFFDFHNARNAVIEGISYTTSLMSNGIIKISPSCIHLINELSLYRWDDKAKKDSVIKENDHACDAMRYLMYTVYFKEYDDALVDLKAYNDWE